MRASWDLDAIGAAFAEAAVDPSRWDAAMELAADVTGGFGALLVPIQGRLPHVPQSRSLDASFETYVKDGWIHRDVRYQCVPTMLRRGVATEFDFTTTDEIARHPYFQEFLAPHGLRSGACVLIASGDDQWSLSIQRSIAQGPISPRETGRLSGLSKKLASAAAPARAFGFARAEAALEAVPAQGVKASSK